MTASQQHKDIAKNPSFRMLALEIFGPEMLVQPEPPIS